jgi:hypothetical protein
MSGIVPAVASGPEINACRNGIPEMVEIYSSNDDFSAEPVPSVTTIEPAYNAGYKRKPRWVVGKGHLH